MLTSVRYASVTLFRSSTIISSAIPERLQQFDGVETVDVGVVWDPVWTPERLSPFAKSKLNMPLEELEPYRQARVAAAAAPNGA